MLQPKPTTRELLQSPTSTKTPHDPKAYTQTFLRLNLPQFNHFDVSLAAEDWVEEVTKKLDMLQCTDAESVRPAAYLLTGAAAAWWET